MKKKYIIIGNSAAGVAAMRTLRKYDKDAHIICFSDEQEPPYNKCFLADYLGKEKTQKQTYTLTLQQAEQLDIDLRLGMRVVDITSDNRNVMLQNGQSESYDALLIATGTGPIWPNIDQIKLYGNVFAFHNLRDAQKIYSFIEQNRPKKAVVIGSGLSGIEAADALHAHNIEVTVVEKDNQILSRHVVAQGADLIEQMMHKKNITLYKNRTVTSASGNGGLLNQVTLSDATCLDTDLVIVAVGLKQNLMLAQKANVKTNAHGIEVNAYLQTSQPKIFAAGDVIATIDQLTGNSIASCTWPDAMQQGMHAALAMTENHKPYNGTSIITSSAFFDLKFFNCGPTSDTSGVYDIIERSGDAFYHRYVCLDGILKGFCLVGNTQQYAKLRRSLLLKQPLNI
ncbi:MAG: FAD/NAD(P)-binding oxidoreductase [Candidatus Dependentiae bacterium]